LEIIYLLFALTVAIRYPRPGGLPLHGGQRRRGSSIDRNSQKAEFMVRQQDPPGIDDKVAFLASADAYPGYVGPVRVIETHLSWVFLTRNRAYKLKKPVERGLLDFTNIDVRYRNCREEVRLNRRLAGDTYIGIEPISLDSRGRLQLGNGGKVVDWLVVMHRLPEADMLSNQIEAGRINEVALERAASTLARFYATAEAVDLDENRYLQLLTGVIEENRRSLAPFALAGCQELCQRQLELMALQPSLFGDRARAGMIIEVHGDLRPQHICLTDPPVIIDCLEFSRSLRIQDRVDELSFLAMECDMLAAPRVGEILFNTYRAITGDRPPIALVAFYKSYRACTRAKLCVWHLEDVAKNRHSHWLQKAANYLVLARRYAEDFDR